MGWGCGGLATAVQRGGWSWRCVKRRKADFRIWRLKDFRWAHSASPPQRTRSRPAHWTRSAAGKGGRWGGGWLQWLQWCSGCGGCCGCCQGAVDQPRNEYSHVATGAAAAPHRPNAAPGLGGRVQDSTRAGDGESMRGAMTAYESGPKHQTHLRAARASDFNSSRQLNNSLQEHATSRPLAQAGELLSMGGDVALGFLRLGHCRSAYPRLPLASLSSMGRARRAGPTILPRPALSVL